METPPQGQEAAAPTPGQAAPSPAQETNAAPTQTPGQAPNSAPAVNDEWDGDVNKLPPELQKWAKKAQAGFTKRWMDEAETRKYGEEYKQLQESEDWKAFQTWRNTGGKQPAPTNEPAKTSLVSAQEWEEAQLDSTGERFGGLVQRMIKAEIEQAVKLYGGEVQQLRTHQQKLTFETALSDFSTANPDVAELHQMGALKPFLKEELNSGSHRTYESAIKAAYDRAAKIRDEINAKALAKANGRVEEKKGSTVLPGRSTGQDEVVLVDRKEDVFEAAFNNALNKKKVKVRSK